MSNFVTDFLSNLSERAVGRAPVLERRRPSLFEPVAGSVPMDETLGDVALRETAVEIVAEKQPSVQQDSGRAASPVDANAIDKLRPSRATRSTREENLPAQPNAVSESKLNRRVDESSSPLIVEKRVEAAPREETRPSLRDRQPRIEPPKEQSPVRVLETRVEKDVVFTPVKEKVSRLETKDKANELSPRQQPSPPIPVVRSDRTRPDVEAKAETRVEKKIEPLVPRHDFKSPPLTRLPQFPVPRGPSRRSAAPKLNAPPAPPAIQITIGRVEVRATAAAPAKRASASAKPTLSLEDYLRARSGESK